MKQPPYTSLIFARGGSKGVKNKNIREVAGKPLIAHAIHCALASQYINEVVVSTDSDSIASVANDFGARVLERPAELAGDKTPELDAWRHAIMALPDVFGHSEQAKQTLFISTPTTTPLRAPEDIDAAITRYHQGDCDVVFGITPSKRSPYLNMVTVNQSGMLEIASKGSIAVRRQDVPQLYDVTTSVYVTSSEYILAGKPLLGESTAYVKIPEARALDIDEEYDLYLADLLLKHPYPTQ